MKIALVGYARSGKNTVGEMIQDYLELNGHGHAQLLAFGDELRDRFHEAFPDVPENPKPREAYERFGQLGRDLDIDMWVKPVERYINTMGDVLDHFIITDLRQPNEEKWCRDNGFILIGVWAYSDDRKERSSNDSNFKMINKSEELLHKIECDHMIFNIGDLENLKKQVNFFLEEELNK